jgi:esterase/lipase superfamily enzyme
VFDELEQVPIDFSLLRYIREAKYDFPQPVMERLAKIPTDESRRGDIRQMGYFLSQRLAPEETDAAVRAMQSPPQCADLQQYAALIADSYLERRASEFIEVDQTEALSYLDKDRATFLITAMFYRLMVGNLEDQVYMDGNPIVQLVATLGDKFFPDVSALFEIDLGIYQEIAPARSKWYQTKDDTIIFSFESGRLAASWQLTWTASRAGMRQVVTELAPVLSGSDHIEHLAALQFVEDAAHYAPEAHPPQFGGGSGPADVRPLAQVYSEETESVSAASKYMVVKVFYGTDRKRSGSEKPSIYYSGNRGELEFGTCEVSIPSIAKREVGKLERPRWRKLEVREDPAKHVVLLKVTPKSGDRFCSDLKSVVKQSKDKQAILFIHGYRVTFEDAAWRTAQLAYDLDIDIPILYSWPSRGKFLGYFVDEDSSEKLTVPHLTEFLNMISTRSGARIIHLIAHSMGNRALTAALREVSAPVARRSTPIFREVVLTAPDIDAEYFRNEIAPQIRSKAGRITLYASSNDNALCAAKLFKWGYARAGEAPGGKVLVVPGVDSIDASAVNTSLMGHSYFGDNRSVLSDLFSLLKDGKPVGKRFGMRSENNENGQYWVFRR